MNYPRILIVGNSNFDTRSAHGILLSNLMAGWNIEKIAVIGESFHNPNYSFCTKYYQLGDVERKKRFPFNLRIRHKVGFSGELKGNNQSLNKYGNYPRNYSWLKSVYYRISDYAGLVHYKDKIILSNKLITWINKFSPEIIYSMLASRELIRFVDDLRINLNIPVAIHIMDDWPTTITENQKFFFKSFWKNKIDKELRHLLFKSTILLSISEAMSNEYYRRYKVRFIPFHNPVDISFWTKHSRMDYSKNDPFIILYAGRIGSGIKKSLLDIAEVINKFCSSENRIEFQIQSTSIDPLTEKLSSYGFVRLNSIVPYSELPKVFAHADLLIIPNDFDENSINFLRYSMPTKASEYMITGTPILIYASDEMAVAQHAMKHKWAYVVNRNDLNLLEKAICELYNNEDLRMNLGNTARNFAINNYDGCIIRKEFLNILNSKHSEC